MARGAELTLASEPHAAAVALDDGAEMSKVAARNGPSAGQLH